MSATSESDLENFPEVPPIIEEKPPENEEPTYLPHRIFMNHVDTYNSRYFTSFVTDQLFGARARLGEMGEGGGGEGGGEGDQKEAVPLGPNYEVIGTLTNQYSRKTEDILHTVNENDENFMEEIMKCGIVIYDISRFQDEIKKALNTLEAIIAEFKNVEDIGPKTFDKFSKNKIFVLISTIMTWGQTRPLNPKKANLALSDADYKKRKTHPNFKEHIDCEREVVKKGQIYPEKLKTFIVCAGVVYGQEEVDLEFFFKYAWYNKVIPIFGPSKNSIPLIHVKDLAKILHALVEMVPTKPQYILAVEQIPTTLEEIELAISKSLGVGKTEVVDLEDAFLYDEISQQIYDKITVDLRMKPIFVEQVLQIGWENIKNLTQNMDKIVQEFKQARHLIPTKVVLHGPPAAGKTTLAHKLCLYYGAHYVSVNSMTDELLDELKDTTQGVEIAEMLEKTEGKLPDTYTANLLRSFLLKNLCQNRGYILDDFPQTTEQAKLLFQMSGGGGENAVDPTKVLPDVVLSFQVKDELLFKRVMELPEEEIAGTQKEEDQFKRRLSFFRKSNTEEESILDYFDELEIHPILIEITEEQTIDEIFDRIITLIGPPHGYGLTLEEEAELKRIEEAQQELDAEKNRLQEQMMIEKAENERQEKLEGWLKTLEILQMEEEKILFAQSEPFRNYLMKFVFPVLTEGLIELVRVKPDDPLDYLAEYLFRENPEGKMFDPAFSPCGAFVLETYEKYGV